MQPLRTCFARADARTWACLALLARELLTPGWRPTVKKSVIIVLTLLVAVALILLLGMAPDPPDEQPPERPRPDRIGAIELTSPAFRHDADIPDRHTCEGAEVSPPLEWGRVPAGAKSLALVVTDPDARHPTKPKRKGPAHWVLYNLPPNAGGLPEGVTERRLPEGTEPGVNAWNHRGYVGPCPEEGRHRYVHRLYALDEPIVSREPLTLTALRKAMKGHVLARGELVGFYARPGSAAQVTAP